MKLTLKDAVVIGLLLVVSCRHTNEGKPNGFGSDLKRQKNSGETGTYWDSVITGEDLLQMDIDPLFPVCRAEEPAPPAPPPAPPPEPEPYPPPTNTDPSNPHPVPSGWIDQGRSPSCWFSSFLNANKFLFPDLDMNKMMKDFRQCMNKAGLPEVWVDGNNLGFKTFAEQLKIMIDCKIESAAKQGKTETGGYFPWVPGSFYTAPAVAEGAPPEKSPCDKIKEALASGAAVTLATSKAPPAGSPPETPRTDPHESLVTAITCPPATPTTITVRNPQNPEPPTVLTLDATSTITGESPTQSGVTSSTYVGAQPTGATVFKK